MANCNKITVLLEGEQITDFYFSQETYIGLPNGVHQVDEYAEMFDEYIVPCEMDMVAMTALIMYCSKLISHDYDVALLIEKIS